MFLWVQIRHEVKGNGSSSTLVIRKTRRSDTAVFTCRASNTFGSSEKTINLIVQVRSFYHLYNLKHIFIW